MRSRLPWLIAALVLVGTGAFATYQLPVVAAGGLLYPSRRESLPPAPGNCVDRAFEGDGVTLRAWDCHAQGPRRGTVIYLHGTADNRGSGVGAINRYTSRGFDVIAYDSRRHTDVSPVDAARLIKAPVLLIHGANDRDTPPVHSELVLAALQTTKRLIVVEGAGHNQSLSRPEIWTQIDEWIDRALSQ